jgi:hypothetical protein
LPISIAITGVPHLKQFMRLGCDVNGKLMDTRKAGTGMGTRGNFKNWWERNPSIETRVRFTF